MKRPDVKTLVLTGLFIALGLALPHVTAHIPELGRRLLPMHLAALLAGFVVGPRWGLVAGFITPLLSSLLFGAPPLFPTAVAMAFELAAYGCLTGVLYSLLPTRRLYIYAVLIASMVGGRIIWGLTTLTIYGITGGAFTWQMFVSGAVINALPGIVLQLVLIPLIIMALQKGGYLEVRG